MLKCYESSFLALFDKNLTLFVNKNISQITLFQLRKLDKISNKNIVTK